MFSENPIFPDCNTEIFHKGEGVCIVLGRASNVERWVQSVARKAGAQVDWHHSGGYANILHLGDAESRGRVLAVIIELELSLQGIIVQVGGPALYRKGVDPGTF